MKPLLDRPLFCLALGLGLGIAPRNSPEFLPGPLLTALSLLLIMAAWLWLGRGRRAAAASALLAAGFLLGLWRVRPLEALLEAPPVEAIAALRGEGRVAQDLGEREDSGRRALVLEEVRLKDLVSGGDWRDWPGRLRLSFEQPQGRPLPAPGDRVSFMGSLRPPDPPGNPGEFDYRSYLLGRGIRGLAACRSRTFPLILSKGAPSPRRLAWLARQRLAQGLESCLGPRAADLARGMVLGDTGGLSSRDMGAYARTGLVHILSVSGLHLALFIALFLWLAGLIGLRRKPRAWLGILLALAYAFICGLPVPAVRAMLLFSLVLLAQALDLDSDAATSLAFGAILILLIQPGALFEAGAQLSFAVSFSLLSLTPVLEARLPQGLPRPLKLAAAGSLAAESASVPLVAWHFSLFSWPSLFATALTAPLMAPIIGLGLAAALTGWRFFGWPLEQLLRLLDWLTFQLAGLPLAAFSTGRPGPLWLAAWLGLLLSFALGLRLARLVPAAALLLLWMLWPGLPWAQRNPGLTQAWFLDVGQGDAIFIRFADGATLLVDAGPQRPDAGSWVLGPALRRLGVNRLDWVVASHPHADHYGGLLWLAGQFGMGELLHSGRQPTARASAWPAVLAAALSGGARLRDLSREAPPEAWRDRIRLLVPGGRPLEGSKHDMHNNNVVLEVEGWLLLPGDLELEGERRLAGSGLLRPCLLLKAGHHGSRTSSNTSFLKALRPKAVVIQAGRRNRYGHPSRAALARLEKAGVELYRSDLQGCVLASHGAQGLKLEPWRQAPPQALFTAPPRARRSLWKNLENSASAKAAADAHEDE